jgi:hypothetical protein
MEVSGQVEYSATYGMDGQGFLFSKAIKPVGSFLSRLCELEVQIEPGNKCLFDFCILHENANYMSCACQDIMKSLRPGT